MRLALDHHFSPLIAVGLRDRGHDARAVAELGWQAEADDALLALCATQRRALLTNNVVDFVVISRRWRDEGRSPAGLVFTSDARWPRRRDTIGRVVEALDVVMRGHPSDDGLLDTVHWL